MLEALAPPDPQHHRNNNNKKNMWPGRGSLRAEDQSATPVKAASLPENSYPYDSSQGGQKTGNSKGIWSWRSGMGRNGGLGSLKQGSRGYGRVLGKEQGGEKQETVRSEKRAHQLLIRAPLS